MRDLHIRKFPYCNRLHDVFSSFVMSIWGYSNARFSADIAFKRSRSSFRICSDTLWPIFQINPYFVAAYKAVEGNSRFLLYQSSESFWYEGKQFWRRRWVLFGIYLMHLGVKLNETVRSFIASTYKTFSLFALDPFKWYVGGGSPHNDITETFCVYIFECFLQN